MKSVTAIRFFHFRPGQGPCRRRSGRRPVAQRIWRGCHAEPRTGQRAARLPGGRHAPESDSGLCSGGCGRSRRAGAGRKLFTGIISFKLGGAPCPACRTVSGDVPLGGGSLGSDLTGVYGRLGAVPTALASLPFPTMQPVFQHREVENWE